MKREPIGPRVALVLGGAGVQAAAALGVSEVLKRENIEPDLVVGCSAGALFGALIAMRADPAQARKMACTLWTRDLTRESRRGALLQMLLPRLLGFSQDFALREDRLIRQRLHQAFGDGRLEDLPIALRVSATDAQTGRSTVLVRGRLVDALRATIASPFMLAPQLIAQRHLIDGFVSDPLPVSAARDARLVLAMGFDAPMPRCVDRPSRLLAQLTASMANNLMDAQLALAEAQGMRLIRIAPYMDRHAGPFETRAIPDLIDAGRRAVASKLPSIRAALAENTVM